MASFVLTVKVTVQHIRHEEKVSEHYLPVVVQGESEQGILDSVQRILDQFPAFDAKQVPTR